MSRRFKPSSLVVLTPVALAGALSVGQASAQDIQNFKPAGGTWNYLSVEGARVMRHEDIVVPSLVINYGHNPLVLRNGNKIEKTVVEHLATADVMLTTGIFDRFDLTLDLPVNYVTGDLLKSTGKDGVALGDIRLVPKLRLAGLEKGEGFGVALAIPVSFPTGQKAKFIGADEFTVNPKLILEARAGGFSFAANGGVRVRPDTKKVKNSNLELGTEVTYGAGIGIELGSDDAVLLTEVFGATPLADVSSAANVNPLEGLLGFRFFTDVGAVFTVAGGTGIVPDYGSPTYRAIFGFAWQDRNYDHDKDGILDEQDKCPDDPEDADGYEDTDGCPDVDNDKDGVNDAVQDDVADEEGIHHYVTGPDKCPMVPEDKDGFQDEDGCPDPDNDHDGIPDVSDRCPNEPEVVNGVDDTDGCPDQGLVKLTKAKIEILDKVYFDFNKATIKPQSFELLNQVAFVIKSAANIKKLQVQGHTDNKGNAKYNLKLSQQRADSVMKYLVGQGVDVTRLEAMGFGDTQPIEENRTQSGRDANRRVEFVITQQE